MLSGSGSTVSYLVVKVKIGQCATRLAEGPEVGSLLHCRNARQLLAEVVGKAAASDS